MSKVNLNNEDLEIIQDEEKVLLDNFAKSIMLRRRTLIVQNWNLIVFKCPKTHIVCSKIDKQRSLVFPKESTCFDISDPLKTKNDISILGKMLISQLVTKGGVNFKDISTISPDEYAEKLGDI